MTETEREFFRKAKEAEAAESLKEPPAVEPTPTPAPIQPTAINHAESFVWWARRNKGNLFIWRCGCGTDTGIKNRVVMGKRKCPGCGDPITLEGIDRSLEQDEVTRLQTIKNERFTQFITTVVIVTFGILFILIKHR